MSDPTSKDITDNLPPTQYLIVDVLAARHRTGERIWTFPSAVRRHLEGLAALGLVHWKSGVEYGTVQAWLTAAGEKAALSETYTPPALNDAYAAGRRDTMKELDRLSLPAKLARISEEANHA